MASTNKLIKRLHKERSFRRGSYMVISGLGSITFAGLTIFLAKEEFGSTIFYNPIFWLLICGWVYFSFVAFLMKLDELKDKKTEDKIDAQIQKIDELINEIRKDRDERNNQRKS
jgi:hypothetical protein